MGFQLSPGPIIIRVMIKLDKRVIILIASSAIILAMISILAYPYFKKIAANSVYVPVSERNMLYTPPATHIDTYALGGTVTKVEGDRITFNAGMVFKGTNNQNNFNYVDRIALVTANTVIHKLNKPSELLTLADIKVGASINVYTAQSPYVLKLLEAQRIEVR